MALRRASRAGGPQSVTSHILPLFQCLSVLRCFFPSFLLCILYLFASLLLFSRLRSSVKRVFPMHFEVFRCLEA